MSKGASLHVVNATSDADGNGNQHSHEQGLRVHHLANLGGLIALAGLDLESPDFLLGALLSEETGRLSVVKASFSRNRRSRAWEAHARYLSRPDPQQEFSRAVGFDAEREVIDPAHDRARQGAAGRAAVALHRLPRGRRTARSARTRTGPGRTAGT